MGLLDGVFGSSMDDPKTQGMLALGLGLLGGRGNFGQVLSQAGMQGMGAYQQGQDRQAQAKQRALQAQMAQMQLEEQLRRQEQEKRDRALIEQFAMPKYKPGSTMMKPETMAGGPLPFNPLEMLQQGASPQAVQTVGAFQPQKKAPIKVGADDTLLDPETLKAVYSGAGKPDEFARALTAAGIDPASPEGRQLMQQRLQKMTTHQPPIVQMGYGSPVAVETNQGPRLVLPPTKPGGQPQMLEIPGQGPIRPKSDKKADTNAQKVSEAQDVLSLLDTAENLIPNSAAGVLQSGRDSLAGMAGISTNTAEATAQLKSIEGLLISKMPKMSGPQSDKDVLLYRQMAGQIADPNLPRGVRLAAVKTIRAINERYANQSGWTYLGPAQ